MEKIKKYAWFMIPSLILLLSASFRLLNLETIPDGFFTDEAALGYNAFSILQTGRDEWGDFLPLTLQSFHDDKPAMYAYFTIPFIKIFGLTEQATRLPAAIFGSLLPLFAYFLVLGSTLKDSSKRAIAAVTGIILAISPWLWEVSRTAIEAGVALSLSVLALALFQKKNRLSLVLGIALTFIVLNTYHTARLLLPLLILGGALFHQFPYKKFLTFFSLALVVIGILLSLTGSSERFRQISIFNSTSSLARREEAIREDGGVDITPLLATRMFHNKLISYGLDFTDNYLTNTSLSYLFVGGAQPNRTAIPETGQFLLVFLPFFIIGLVVGSRSLPAHKMKAWMLYWLLIAAIPASITYAELPHSYRTLYLAVPVSIFISLGIVSSYNYISNLARQHGHSRRILMLVPILFLFALISASAWNTAKAWHQYARHQQVHQPWYRLSGMKELVSYVTQLSDVSNREIVITDSYMEPYIYFLFYNQIDPLAYQQLDQKRLSRHELDVEKKEEWSMFGITFTREKCPKKPYSELGQQDIYFVHLECDTELGFKRIGSINFADGVPMFHIQIPQTPEEYQKALQKKSQ